MSTEVDYFKEVAILSKPTNTNLFHQYIYFLVNILWNEVFLPGKCYQTSAKMKLAFKNYCKYNKQLNMVGILMNFMLIIKQQNSNL